jgi:uncharacterized membrane protein
MYGDTITLGVMFLLITILLTSVTIHGSLFSLPGVIYYVIVSYGTWLISRHIAFLKVIITNVKG